MKEVDMTESRRGSLSMYMKVNANPSMDYDGIHTLDIYIYI